MHVLEFSLKLSQPFAHHSAAFSIILVGKSDCRFLRLASGTTKQGGCAKIVHSGSVHRLEDRRIMSPGSCRVIMVRLSCADVMLIIIAGSKLAAHFP
jgi:hypothetical protein